MSTWLDPLRAALDAAPIPVTVFVRDDDTGWADQRLFAMLDLFDAHEAPIDLAVIPVEMGPDLAAELARRHAASSGRLGLHQHGFSHTNHEVEGRKCEFGPARSRDAQRTDIAEGHRLLEALLGDVLDPIFTPPWNRCTTDTGTVLAELGIGVLSRDVTAEPLGVPGLAELPVQVDWFAHSKGRRLDRHELGALLAARASGPTPMGVMLHHAVMDDEELVGVAELLQVLTDHDQVRLRSMTAVAATITTGEMA